MEGNRSGLVIALGAGLGCALLVIAFLLGRVTARPAETVRIVEPAQAVVVPAESRIPAAPVSEPTAVVLPVREAGGTPPDWGGWIPPSTPDARGAPASNTAPYPPRSADQPAIAGYFAGIEKIDDVGAGDPQAFATSMLQSMSSGDFSGFDDLLGKSRQQLERLRGITPPRACLEHHRLALSLSADSVAMMERLKAALMRGDSAGLLTIATEGRDLETQANALKTMGDAIKRQAGL
jgi:hypothetical protein